MDLMRGSRGPPEILGPHREPLVYTALDTKHNAFIIIGAVLQHTVLALWYFS